MSITTNPIHESWLNWEQIMRQRYSDEVWSLISKQVQGAFYAGAFTVLNSAEDKSAIWSACETGMADAMGKPGARLVNDKGQTYTEAQKAA